MLFIGLFGATLADESFLGVPDKKKKSYIIDVLAQVNREFRWIFLKENLLIHFVKCFLMFCRTYIIPQLIINSCGVTPM